MTHTEPEDRSMTQAWAEKAAAEMFDEMTEKGPPLAYRTEHQLCTFFARHPVRRLGCRGYGDAGSGSEGL